MLFTCPEYANVRVLFENKVMLPRPLEDIPLETILKENLKSERLKDLVEYLESLGGENTFSVFCCLNMC